MHFSSAISIAIVASLPIVLGSPILESRQNGVTCQTSSASPSNDDVTDVINKLNAKGGDCRNKNGHASDCTTLVKSGGAAISICGGEEDESCADVTNYARQIQQTCLSDGLVGGTYTISAATRVEVH